MVVVLVVLVIGEGSKDIGEKREKHPGALLNNSDNQIQVLPTPFSKVDNRTNPGTFLKDLVCYKSIWLKE